MIYIRATQQDKARWIKQAEKLGKTLSEYIRYLLDRK